MYWTKWPTKFKVAYSCKAIRFNDVPYLCMFFIFIWWFSIRRFNFTAVMTLEILAKESVISALHYAAVGRQLKHNARKSELRFFSILFFSYNFAKSRITKGHTIGLFRVTKGLSSKNVRFTFRKVSTHLPSDNPRYTVRKSYGMPCVCFYYVCTYGFHSNCIILRTFNYLSYKLVIIRYKNNLQGEWMSIGERIGNFTFGVRSESLCFFLFLPREIGSWNKGQRICGREKPLWLL